MVKTAATVLVFSTTTTCNASPVIPPLPQNHPILLRGATVHPVSGPDIANGEILFNQGKIQAVGKNLTLPAGTESIDLTGKQIYPGLISANTVLGLTEIGAVRATKDLAEPGDINPNARAEVAINPDSELLPVTRSNGILTALSVPQIRNGLLAGTSAVIKMDGWTWEDMTLKAPVGMHLFWPDLSINRDPIFPKSPEEQQTAIDERLKLIRDTFATARAYQKAKQQGTPDHDLRWEALLPVLEGKLPVFVHADELKQIESALQWSATENIKIVLVGGQDAWRAADQLKQRDIPVIVSPVLALPLRRWEAYDTPYSNPAKLAKAGVRFCIANAGNDFEAPHDRNLPYQAAMASAYGLPPLEALKAVTLYPAQILGVDNRLGSLEAGMDATLIVTNGDPLEITTHVERAYIQGRPVDLSNRQTKLYDKYRQKYQQLKQQ
jgi:imidazolonepropionase-like amidohydrolase